MIRRRYPRINGWGLSILVLLLSPAWLAADEATWGHLAGRFVWDGPAPRQRTLPVTKDQAVFGDAVPDESLLVHAENRGIANVLVYLWPDDGEKLRVHSSYDNTARSKVELAMEKGQFVPRVLLVRTGQTLVQGNKDNVGTTESDARGRLAVTIKEGPNQLGDVLLSPRIFDENR